MILHRMVLEKSERLLAVQFRLWRNIGVLENERVKTISSSTFRSFGEWFCVRAAGRRTSLRVADNEKIELFAQASLHGCVVG